PRACSGRSSLPAWLAPFPRLVRPRGRVRGAGARAGPRSAGAGDRRRDHHGGDRAGLRGRAAGGGRRLRRVPGAAAGRLGARTTGDHETRRDDRRTGRGLMPLDLPSMRPSAIFAGAQVVATTQVAVVTGDPLVHAALRARLATIDDVWLVDDPSRASVLIWDPPPLSAGELPILPTTTGVVIAIVGESAD